MLVSLALVDGRLCMRRSLRCSDYSLSVCTWSHITKSRIVNPLPLRSSVDRYTSLFFIIVLLVTISILIVVVVFFLVHWVRRLFRLYNF